MGSANPLTSGFWTTSTFPYCYSCLSSRCRHLVMPFKLCAGLPLFSLDPLWPVISKTVTIFFLKGKCICVTSLPKNHSVSLVRHLFGVFPTPSIFLVIGLWENLVELPVALQSIKLCRAFIPSTWNLPPPALFCWDLVEIAYMMLFLGPIQWLYPTFRLTIPQSFFVSKIMNMCCAVLITSLFIPLYSRLFEHKNGVSLCLVLGM